MGFILNNTTTKTASTPGFWLRAGAFVIDGTLLSATLALSGILYETTRLPPSPLFGLAWLGIAAVYLVWLPVAWKGQTVGKRAAGIAVITMDGSPLTYRLFLRRWVAYLASALPLGAGFLAAVFTHEKRALHDLISGTRVVRVREIGFLRGAAVVSAAVLVPLAVVLGSLASPAYRGMAARARKEGLKQDRDSQRTVIGILGEAGRLAPENYGLELVSAGEDGDILYDKRGNADIFLPKGYELAAPVPNKQVTYDFGMKHKTENYEIRIRFDRPLGPSADEKKGAAGKEPGSRTVSFVDPGKPSLGWAQSMGINLSGRPVSHFEIFPDLAVKKEFGADWGITSEAFKLKDPDFSGKYIYARIAAQVHKKGAGIYTIFQLFDSPDTDARLRNEAFHAVKFRSD